MSSRSDPMSSPAVFSAPWIDRTVAVGILVAILLAVYSVLIAPLVAAYGEINGSIAQSTDLLARYQRVTAQYPDLKGLLDRVNDDHTASGVYLSGDTDALAAARLQEIVNARVESNGAQVRSVQILPTKEDGDFRRVGVRVQLIANIAAVARILYGFEAGGTFLFVDNLDISNRKSRRRAGEQTNPELLVRLDLTGYVRPEATK